MACNNCLSLDQIPECTESMVLGEIAVDTEVYIYVKNTFSGYMHRQQAISDNDGELVLNLEQPDPAFYNQDSHYEVWVTLRTDDVKLTFTEDTVEYDCLEISFYKINDTYELP
jgi:hypothetical protein